MSPVTLSLYFSTGNVSGCQSEVDAEFTEGISTELQAKNRCGLPKYKQ